MENHVCPRQAVTRTGLFLETLVHLPFSHLTWPVGQTVVLIKMFFMQSKSLVQLKYHSSLHSAEQSVASCTYSSYKTLYLIKAWWLALKCSTLTGLDCRVMLRSCLCFRGGTHLDLYHTGVWGKHALVTTTVNDTNSLSRSIISYCGVGRFIVAECRFYSVQYLGTSLHLEIPVMLNFTNPKHNRVHAQARGSQILVNESPWQLNFVRWHLILWASQCGTLPFWHLEF